MIAAAWYVPFFVPDLSLSPYSPELQALEMSVIYQGSTLLRALHGTLLLFPWLIFCQYLTIMGSIFCALRLTLDAYGNAIVNQSETQPEKIEDLLAAWRSQNAMVRLVGFETQLPFALSITIPSLTFLTSMVLILQNGSEGYIVFAGGSAVLSVALIVFFLHSASSVTMRCMRIPTLVNGLAIASELKKNLAVQYIRNSDSGYRLFNEPVSLFFVVKVVYGLLVILIFVVREMLNT